MNDELYHYGVKGMTWRYHKAKKNKDDDSEQKTYTKDTFKATIVHSAKGSTWTKKDHKYIEKRGSRYIYPNTQLLSPDDVHEQHEKNMETLEEINPISAIGKEIDNASQGTKLGEILDKIKYFYDTPISEIIRDSKDKKEKNK